MELNAVFLKWRRGETVTAEGSEVWRLGVLWWHLKERSNVFNPSQCLIWICSSTQTFITAKAASFLVRWAAVLVKITQKICWSLFFLYWKSYTVNTYCSALLYEISFTLYTNLFDEITTLSGRPYCDLDCSMYECLWELEGSMNRLGGFRVGHSFCLNDKALKHKMYCVINLLYI